MVVAEDRVRETARLRPGDRVVVIGAGPAGLTAAYLLAQKGVDVTVLEADDVVGGLSRTVEYHGFRFDIGGHRFFTKIEPVQKMWEEVLGEEFRTVGRLSRIYYNGKFFDYPLRPMNALAGLGLWNACACVTSYLRAHFSPSPVEENFEQWVSNRFGRRLYETFFKTYTEKVWGLPCSEIRAEWAAQRIKGLSLARAILSAASVNRRSTKIRTLINEFRYPRLGPGQMWELTTARIRRMGGRVLLRHKVDSIELGTEGREKKVVAVSARTPEGNVRFPADHVISSMPLRGLVRALQPQPPAEVLDAGAGIRYRDFLVVALILDEPDLFPDNWIYVHDPDVRVGRVQNFGNWSADLVPDPAKSCLGMEYFCFEGDGLWSTPDEELLELAAREVGALKLADPARVVDGAVVRMKKAYPIYDGVYRAHLETVRAHIDGFSNLHPVGRNGMHKYNNQDHAMLTAMLTVWNLEGACYDVWSVNTDYEYHEEQRLGPEGQDEGEAAAKLAVVAGGGR